EATGDWSGGAPPGSCIVQVTSFLCVLDQGTGCASPPSSPTILWCGMCTSHANRWSCSMCWQATPGPVLSHPGPAPVAPVRCTIHCRLKCSKIGHRNLRTRRDTHGPPTFVTHDARQVRG